MNAVGIDVSKGKSMIAVMRSPREMAVKPYEVRHNAEELKKLAHDLKALDVETRVIMEYTGRYHEPIAQALHEAGLYVSVVNPILTHDYGNNSVRRVKTDKKDAIKIANYGLENWHGLRRYTPVDTTREDLKFFSRQFTLYMKVKTMMTNNLIALLDQTFPGANNIFDNPVRKDGHQKWVDFITDYWHCECVCDMDSVKFIERYKAWCKRRGYYFTEEKASEIFVSSVGHYCTLPKNATTKFLITKSAAQWTALSKTVETFRAQMLELASKLPEYPVVMSMYGVGDTTGSQLMAEIGDIRRFKRRKSLIAYAGIDVPPDQSGRYDAKSGSISKRGSSHLRRTLFQVMRVYLQHAPLDESVYQFLDKKRSEKKPYYVYMMAGSNKFLRIYYAKVKEYLESQKTEPQTQNAPCQG